MPRHKEMTVSIAGDTLNLRENETRTVRLPMTLRLIGGILYFTPPDIAHYQVSDDKEVVGDDIEKIINRKGNIIP